MKTQEFPIVVKRGSAVVRIYKTPCRGENRFTIAYWLNGTRKRQTFNDLASARQEAALAANQLTKGDLDVLTLTSADRASYLRARALLDPLGLPLEAAAAQLAEAVKRLGGVSLNQAVEFYVRRNPGQIEPRLVGEVADELLATKRADGLSARYLKQLEYDLKRFRKQFGGRIGDVSGLEMDAWLRGLGVSPRTRNNLRASVQCLFKFAKGRRYLPKDHDELEAVPVVKAPGGEIEIYTPGELTELLAAAKPELVPFLAIAAFAGVRHAELQRLDWADLKRDADIIEIRAGKAKTASRRVVPILPNLRAWLEPHWQEAGPVCRYANMVVQFEQLTAWVNQGRREDARRGGGSQGRSVGTDFQGSPAKAARRRQGSEAAVFAWKHNALRHSFISYRVSQTQNVAQVALEAGNSPQMIFRHYRELVRPTEAAKWFGIMPEMAENVAVLPQAAAA